MCQVLMWTTRPSGHEDKKHTHTIHSHADLFTSAALAK